MPYWLHFFSLRGRVRNAGAIAGLVAATTLLPAGCGGPNAPEPAASDAASGAARAPATPGNEQVAAAPTASGEGRTSAPSAPARPRHRGDNMPTAPPSTSAARLPANQVAAQEAFQPSSGSAAAAWPLFRGDSVGTGASQAELPAQPEVLWKFAAVENMGGFEATCAIADGVVYAPCLDGFLYALNLSDGALRWKHQTELGFLASAAVRDGRVFIGDVDGRFYCLDAASGELRWGFQAKAEIDSSANFYGDSVLVGSQDATLYRLHAETGELVWQFTIEDQIRCMPTVVGDRCFLAGCDGKLHVIDLEKGTSVAQIDIQAPTGCTPAVAGELAYFGTEGEVFFCVNWKRGEIVWSYRNPTRSFPFRSSAAVSNTAVVVGGRDKLLRALAPLDGRLLWSMPFRGRIDGSPIICGGRAWVGAADGRLVAVDLASGEKLWEYEAGGGFASSPAVAEGRLVIGNDDGQLFCFGARP